MSNFVSYFKQKLVWIGGGAIFLIVVLLCTALVYPTVNVEPKDIPVAILVQDKGVNIPHKGFTSYGDMIKNKITDGKSDSPFKWTVVTSMQSLNDGFDNEKYYGAIVVPEDFTQKITSIQSPVQSQASVKLYINQGMNNNVATMVSQAFTKIVGGINLNLRQQIIGQISKKSKIVNLSQAQFLSSPIIAKTVTVNPIGSHSLSGNAPASLSQICWISVLIGSICLFLAAKKEMEENNGIGVTFAQIAAGILVSILVSSFVMLIAYCGFGMDIYDVGKTWLFITFACYCFYLFQTSILNLIGIAGAAICMLIFFFTNPILMMAKELIPDPTYNLLYQWVPLRFSSEGLRDILFFHKDLNLSSPLGVLAITGVICCLIIIFSRAILKRKVNLSYDEELG